MGQPCRVEVLGSVLQFPELGSRGQSGSHRTRSGSTSETFDELPPLILLVGSCMSAGKTAAACARVRSATARGLDVGVAKVTGVALRRDVLEMQDHGAVCATTLPMRACLDL